MSEIDIDSLVTPISEEEPAGSDLEYDPDFVELERLTTEAETRDADDPNAPEPDWRAIDGLVHTLLERTRDLRVATIACRSALQEDGWPGYSQHLGLVRALIVTMWDHVHPQLDPDDDNDPTMRMNILSSLTDTVTSLNPLRTAPLVSSRALGRFSYRDMQIASGEISLPEGSDESPTSASTIDSAFMDADLEEIQATALVIANAIKEVDTIEQTTTELVGAGNAISLEELRKLLKAINGNMEAQLARLGGSEAPVGDAADPEAGAVGSAAARGGAPGQINSRQDVIATLDRIVAYYRNTEPASPVPMLMQRAKRLVNMDFMEIVRDMAPDGVHQVELIRGGAADEYSGESAAEESGYDE